MSVPKEYEWLSSIGALPRTISQGVKLLGVQEVVGRGSNRTIMSWRDILNGAAPAGLPIVKGYSDDDIPWCGLLVAFIIYLRRGDVNEVVANPLWAANWSKYGEGVANQNQPCLGDVLVFKRPNGNHVGFYIAEDATHFHVLGGNQGNKVSIIRIAKNRCWAVRRTRYQSMPASVKPYHVKATGLISTNEA